MDYQKVGEAIRLKRAQLGYTQAVTAELSNLSVNFYSEVERGEKKGRLETYVNIAKALEMSLDTMLADVYDPASEAFISDLINDLRHFTPDQRKLVKEIVEAVKKFPSLKA